MFTGIIEETGIIIGYERRKNSSSILLEADIVLQGVKLGDSIAVNGVCVTVVSFSEKQFTADVMAVTLEKTNIGKLSVGKKVNLERALLLGDRIGGHLVSGHIDTTEYICNINKQENITLIEIHMSEEIRPFIIPQGSITIDGVSLTVAKVTHQSFFVSIIPLSFKETIINTYTPGSIVNIETDMIGKYLYHFSREKFSNTPKKSSLTREFLIEHGF